jgi:hypothetical protein
MRKISDPVERFLSLEPPCRHRLSAALRSRRAEPLVAVALGASGPLVRAVAAACALAFLGISLTVQQYRRIQRRYVALFPTADSSIDSQATAPGVAARLTDVSTWMPGRLEGRR